MTTASSATLLPFVLTCVVIELTPGPNMAYLAVLSADKGRRAGFAAMLGIALGLLVVGIAAALGLTAIIASSPALYAALRWAGAFYLLWLAWEAWRGERETSPGQAAGAASDGSFILRGLITNLLNPKAGLFYIAVLPTFLDPSRDLARQAIVLSLVYVTIASAVHSSIVVLADAARPWLVIERRSQTMRRVLAVLLAGIAIWLFWETRSN